MKADAQLMSLNTVVSMKIMKKKKTYSNSLLYHHIRN